MGPPQPQPELQAATAVAGYAAADWTAGPTHPHNQPGSNSGQGTSLHLHGRTHVWQVSALVA